MIDNSKLKTTKKASHFCEAFSFLAPLIDQKYNHQTMIEYGEIRKVIC